MGDNELARLGMDVKRRLDAIARGVKIHCDRYLENKIRGEQFLNGMNSSVSKIEAQLQRLDVTMLGGMIEDFAGYDNDNTVLGGQREDL